MLIAGVGNRLIARTRHRLCFGIQSKPFALNYSTDGDETFSIYYYILNLQGDVVKLVWSPASGDHVFEYVEVASSTYNAWGEILSSSGEMADVNPLRYRGYYYDSETGLYYLQSRYYDPVTHRFINADGYASTGQGFVGTNQRCVWLLMNI